MGLLECKEGLLRTAEPFIMAGSVQDGKKPPESEPPAGLYGWHLDQTYTIALCLKSYFDQEHGKAWSLIDIAVQQKP